MSAAESRKPTHVVTCFLLRGDRGRDEVLVVQRSERVRTYRGAWAGVSGYLEPGVEPLSQAYTEIREETGLTADKITLLATGNPVAFEDAALGQAWVVHPFLFRVARPEAIVTDWEATTMRWIEPRTLTQLDTVPRLVEALAAVLPHWEDIHDAD